MSLPAISSGWRPIIRAAAGLTNVGCPVQLDAEDAFGGGLENQLVLLAEPRQLVRLLLERLALAEQLHEDVDLGAEDVRVERLEDVVDGAELVAAEDIRLAARQRGEEDDRRVAGAVALADQAGGLEAVEVGHLHVEQHDREVRVQQMTEGLACPTAP